MSQILGPHPYVRVPVLVRKVEHVGAEGFYPRILAQDSSQRGVQI